MAMVNLRVRSFCEGLNHHNKRMILYCCCHRLIDDMGFGRRNDYPAGFNFKFKETFIS